MQRKTEEEGQSMDGLRQAGRVWAEVVVGGGSCFDESMFGLAGVVVSAVAS